jgi:cobalamin synthase
VIGDARVAVGFLTRLPIGGGELTAAGLSRAAAWFPVVGLLVGGVMARRDPRVGTFGALALVFAVALSLAALAPLDDGAGAIAVGVACAVTVVGGMSTLRVLGGVSGDTFGAVNKVVEIAAYVTLAAAWTD